MEHNNRMWVEHSHDQISDKRASWRGSDPPARASDKWASREGYMRADMRLCYLRYVISEHAIACPISRRAPISPERGRLTSVRPIAGHPMNGQPISGMLDLFEEWQISFAINGRVIYPVDWSQTNPKTPIPRLISWMW